MTAQNTNTNPWLTALEKQMQKTCFCKWRTECKDKNSPECCANKNLYAEGLRALHQAKS